jgi:hypothetical protein
MQTERVREVERSVRSVAIVAGAIVLAGLIISAVVWSTRSTESSSAAAAAANTPAPPAAESRPTASPPPATPPGAQPSAAPAHPPAAPAQAAAQPSAAKSAGEQPPDEQPPPAIQLPPTTTAAQPPANAHAAAPTRRGAVPPAATVAAKRPPKVTAPAPRRVAESAAPTPAPAPAPAPAPTQRDPEQPLSIEPRLASLDVRGALSNAVVRRAIDRVLPATRSCRSDRAGDVEIQFNVGESKRAAQLRATGLSASSCLSGVLSGVRTDAAPDTGDVEVRVRFSYDQPQRSR